ncbi:FAD-dependent oxidoreductase [Deinococcus sp. Arct2-2]|uniref:FAD-dependent oxidoreductase n=1 Tax=Deinococcus sp. Arct2-2 TaxID=2568653 RepID=UPI00269989B5
MAPLSADIMVVGAAGAWRLAQRSLKVSVIEPETPASGSTGNSVAGVRHQFTNETHVLLAGESTAEYAALPSET